MSKKHLHIPIDDLGAPDFSVPPLATLRKREEITFFELSSHHRAREALEFGVKMRDKGFHIFVLGEDQSGRVTASVSFLEECMRGYPCPPDLIYLNNFCHPHQPNPCAVPSGMGIQIQQDLEKLVEEVCGLINKTLTNPKYLSHLQSMSEMFETNLQSMVGDLRIYAMQKGFDLETTSAGSITVVPNKSLEMAGGGLSAPQTEDWKHIREQLNEIGVRAHAEGQELNQRFQKIKLELVESAIGPVFRKFSRKYKKHLGGWVDELREDVLHHIDDFITETKDLHLVVPEGLKDRYSINLFVDNSSIRAPRVVLEPNPTYESLFGSIKYKTMPGGGLETNYLLVRPGSLHQANGGILIIRADSLARDPFVWDMLKAALRDREIRIEEMHRENTAPLVQAPEPHPFSLDVQVVLVGHPRWYYNFFFHELDFQNYFKIKAEIDTDMPASAHNIRAYAKLIQQAAKEAHDMPITIAAMRHLMSLSSRWVEDRTRLSAQFERVMDIIVEAGQIAKHRHAKSIDVQDTKETMALRLARNARVEDRNFEEITNHQILISTQGAEVGQVNALTVLNMGDHTYGLPARVSAQTYASDLGIINLERLTELSGPIQQKGTYTLEGLLNGLLAQNYPVSFGCSLTFEQNYAGIEGDSATLAEFLAIISSLSGVAVRQDIAVTGSLNQFGDVQAVGGIIEKVEGFYKVCKQAGLTGSQGVIIPKANCRNLVLRSEVVRAIEEGDFFVAAVEDIIDAVDLVMEWPLFGKGRKKGVIDLAMDKLQHYDTILGRRATRSGVVKSRQIIDG